MSRFSLKDEIALVTGAGSGIGQRIAIGLAEAGADVALFDLPDSAGIKETARAIGELKRRAAIFAGNVTDAKALAAAVGETESKLGSLTVAVNSAGIANATAAEDM